MNTRREIGGYIEYEHYHGSLYHDDAVKLNCGRHCLTYLIRAKKIRKIWLPLFLCSSVSEICEKEGTAVQYYHVNKNFTPQLDGVNPDNFVYVVNYYGQISNEYINTLHETYPNLIVDNAQAYFQMPTYGVDTLYTCRKYFGVPDGAFLYTDTSIIKNLPEDESFNNMDFLMGRFERTAEEFYGKYVANNKRFRTEPIKKMSRLTENILRSIDYDNIRKIRDENFRLLHESLRGLNRLQPSIPYGAFMYPLWVDGSDRIRQSMLEKRIYIPVLWPCVNSPVESDQFFVKNILPLPVDQRYGAEDMNYLANSIIEYINHKQLTTDDCKQKE